MRGGALTVSTRLPDGSDEPPVGMGSRTPSHGPTTPALDPELLAAGDRRNVVDRYRYWRQDAIVEDLGHEAAPVPRGGGELGA